MIHKKYKILSWQQQEQVEIELTYKIYCKEQSLEWVRPPLHRQQWR
jgi:hypothetical protein